MSGEHGHTHLALMAVCLLAALLLAGGPAGALTHNEMYASWAGAAERFEEERTLLAPGSEESGWVQRVGGRIVASWPDRRWVTHEFLVVDDPVLDAWSFPLSPVQHKVYVTTGLLDLIRQRGGAQCDDQLAGVLGHELAHLMREHHLLRHRREEMLGLEATEDLADWPARVLGKWRQEDEFEADKYGAFHVLHAGYRFDGITDFLAQCLRRHGDSAVLAAAPSTAERPHPPLTVRIAALEHERDTIEQAKQLFERGLDLLRAGSWRAAGDCFAEVRKTFWLSPTVVHNLAYTELRRYEDTLTAGPPIPQSVSTSYVAEFRLKGPRIRIKGPDPGEGELLLAEATADFLKACELDRDGEFLPPRLGLACAYLYKGEDAKAQASLQELQVGTQEPGYLNLTGVLAERGGDLAAARRAFRKALGLPAEGASQHPIAEVEQSSQPHLPALYNLARATESDGRLAEAAHLYGLYLRIEGDRSWLGVRAREGLLRCGGELPEVKGPGVRDSYRGINLRSSGTLVVEAALGKPEVEESFDAGRSRIVLYRYPSQGICVVLVGTDGEAAPLLAHAAMLSEPSEDEIAGMRIGDTTTALEERLGRPREVIPGPDGSAWWDYARLGLAFRVADGKAAQCIIGGWR
jgi:Zn-dependent protease with chaperone function